MEVNVLTPVPEKEYERLRELSDLDVDYSALGEELYDFAKLAAKIGGVEKAQINLIDSTILWTVAAYGFAVGQQRRENSVCQYTIMSNEPFELEDYRLNEKVKGLPIFEEHPEITGYYGVPLNIPNGYNIGTLSLFGAGSVQFSVDQKEMLALVAVQVVERIINLKEKNELRKKVDDEVALRRSLSHDLRGPVGGIIGLSDMIREQGEDNEMDSVLEMIEMIHEGGEAIIEKVNDVLAQKKKRGQNREPEAHEFSLRTLKAKLEQLYTPLAIEKEIDLTIVHHSKHEDIPFPKAKLLQVAGNIIANALKFTPEDGMVMVRLEYDLNASGDFLLITVKDTGEIVDNSKIEALTQSVDLINGRHLQDERGYDAGLTIAAKLVRKAEGTLRIECEEGEGCKLDIKYPLT
ncbi:GAF domain-containing sensor histidine kinase [Gracilimonas mengyeensis]|uniref:histidine kinase n=1 Tax=Gracilimonas mengyeensis TaxID=1302730 RepID=A0A521B8Y0_9BACT|nr:GAF domain-containing sensor histidine kinase [Gracilimonas mengyeensis]SMO43471.1 Signal transduction histidine kinase [Gracilimonas mengyeensis]